MKLLIELNFLHASMAADPVSPDVAPKTIAVLFCFINDLLKNAAANCKPKSLKAAVVHGITLKYQLIYQWVIF